MLSPVGKVFIYVTVTYGTLKFFCRLNPKLLIAIWITVQIKSGSFILLNKIEIEIIKPGIFYAYIEVIQIKMFLI